MFGYFGNILKMHRFQCLEKLNAFNNTGFSLYV